MKYSDQQRIEKMRETTEKLLRYVEKENITPEIIFAEEAVQWTVTTPLYNIGEHAANLSEDFKKQYPDIPWVKIAGLRHRLVHHYEDINRRDPKIQNDIHLGCASRGDQLRCR